MTGRVLYPRYFSRNDGLASTNPSPAYASRDYPRTGFYFLTLGEMNLAALLAKGVARDAEAMPAHAALRARAGQIGEQDFEALMSAAATAWPAELPPAEALKFEIGRAHV